MITAVCFNRNG